MRNSKVSRKCLWLAIIIVLPFLVVMTPAAIFAGGGRGEPGAGCPNPLLIDFKYVDPPYIGTIIAEWEDGNVWITGLVQQEGNRGCVGYIPDTTPAFFGPMSSEAFQNLKAVDNKEGAISIKGTCLVGWTSYFNCGEIGYFEIVSIGNLDYSADQKSFTAKVTIKLLRETVK